MARRPSAPLMTTTSLSVISLLLIFSFLQAEGGASSSSSSSSTYVPVRRVVYRSLTQAAAMTTEAAVPAPAPAPYEPFEVCRRCRCCPPSSNGNGSSCVDTSCCYAINCNLPGKPFGTCAFTPQTCGCGANNCTKPSS